MYGISGGDCITTCVRIGVLLEAVQVELDQEIKAHGVNTGTRRSLSDAKRALLTAQEDAHRRCRGVIGV